jgi:hypothetical protein
MINIEAARRLPLWWVEKSMCLSINPSLTYDKKNVEVIRQDVVIEV